MSNIGSEFDQRIGASVTAGYALLREHALGDVIDYDEIEDRIDDAGWNEIRDYLVEVPSHGYRYIGDYDGWQVTIDGEVYPLPRNAAASLPQPVRDALLGDDDPDHALQLILDGYDVAAYWTEDGTYRGPDEDGVEPIMRAATQ